MTLLALFRTKNTSIYPQMGQGGKHLSLIFNLFNFSVYRKLSFRVSCVTDYLADDQDCGKIPVGILIVGPLRFYHNFPAKIWAVRILLLKYLKPVKTKLLFRSSEEEEEKEKEEDNNNNDNIKTAMAQCRSNGFTLDKKKTRICEVLKCT
jgi:hypothetical protein